MSRRFVSSLSLFASLALPLTLVDACSSDSSKPRDQAAERDASTSQRDSGSDDSTEEDAGAKTDSGFEPIVDKLTNAGATCAENSECTGESKDNRCLLDVIGLSFPGGYCSTTCVADSECGADARCPLAPLFENTDALALLGPLAAQIKDLSTCLKTCETAGDCREDEGYRCASADEAIQGASQFGVDLSVRYCIPPTDALLPDAGGLDGGVDDAGLDAGDAAVDDDAGDADTDADAGDAGDGDAQPST